MKKILSLMGQFLLPCKGGIILDLCRLFHWNLQYFHIICYCNCDLYYRNCCFHFLLCLTPARFLSNLISFDMVAAAKWNLQFHLNVPIVYHDSLDKSTDHSYLAWECSWNTRSLRSATYWKQWDQQFIS